MNLHEAITEKLIIPDTWEEYKVWRCAKCGNYLCKGHEAEHMLFFSCKCHDDKLKSDGQEHQTSSNPILS